MIRKSLFLGEMERTHLEDLQATFTPIHAEFVESSERTPWWARWTLDAPASGQELAYYFLEKPSFEKLSPRQPDFLRDLQTYAKHYFRQAGLLYDFEPTDVDIRFWQSTLEDEREPVVSSQPVDTDEDLVNGLAFTCMMVCRKDEGVQGGDMAVFPDYGHNMWTHLMGMSTVHTVPLQEGSVVVKRADMGYQLTPQAGTGVMQWVTVTIWVDL